MRAPSAPGHIANFPIRSRSSCLAKACGEQPRNMLGPVRTRISRARKVTRSARSDDFVQNGPGLTESRTGHVAV